MKKLFVLLVGFGLVVAMSGCASLGVGGGKPKFWTYNLKQSLSRSAGDVAMTMVLDQGVDKVMAVGFCEAVIALFSNEDITGNSLRSAIADLTAKNPTMAGVSNKILDVLPADLTDAQIPPEIKDAVVSFLRDGAIHGASMYKDGLRMRLAPAGNEKLN